jgi:hypothetical protein
MTDDFTIDEFFALNAIEMNEALEAIDVLEQQEEREMPSLPAYRPPRPQRPSCLDLNQSGSGAIESLRETVNTARPGFYKFCTKAS